MTTFKRLSHLAGHAESRSAVAAPQRPVHPEATLASCRDLTIVFGSGDARVVALAGVDVSFVADEMVSLWGPSGSGKTTLLHALGGLVEPTEGVVLWQGAALSSLDSSARTQAQARGIAYVFQGSNLLPVFTAYENVAFAAYASGERNDVKERALELLTLVGLREKADSLPPELSGGEAQRVAIARALAQRPKLLLCDEPTGHLDTDTTARVLELIDALQTRFGFTLVIATHDADVAAGLGRVIELRDGHVVTDEA
jgi:putative ABC transport system ATP-binding protein